MWIFYFLSGFDVAKTGDARIGFVGFPSVGKSTLLSNLAGVYSEVAAYEFTTLTTVPGKMILDAEMLCLAYSGWESLGIRENCSLENCPIIVRQQKLFSLETFCLITPKNHVQNYWKPCVGQYSLFALFCKDTVESIIDFLNASYWCSTKWFILSKFYHMKFMHARHFNFCNLRVFAYDILSYLRHTFKYHN